MPNGIWLTVLMVSSGLLILAAMRARRIQRTGSRITAMTLLSLLSISAVSASVIALAGIVIANSRTAPIPNVHIIGNREQIDRGAQIADSFCGACHTKTGPLTGGVDIGKDLTVPVGSFVSSNLTPAGVLSHWTDGEIFRTVTTGVNKFGKPIFPVMPYHNYGQLDREDIYSVISYIRTLKPIEAETPESVAEFPMNFIINTNPVEASFATKPSPEDQLAYGKYVFTAAACNECHT